MTYFYLFFFSFPYPLICVVSSNSSGEHLEEVQLPLLGLFFYCLIGQKQPAAPLSHTEIWGLIYLTLSYYMMQPKSQ